MKLRKTYIVPIICEVKVDVDISICMTSPNTPPDPGDKPSGVDASPQNSNETFKDNGFDNPFSR